MPPKQKHLDQAQHNETLYATLDHTKFSDWAMTLMFYSALHHVDAVLDHKYKYHPGGHAVRDVDVQKRPELRPIAKNYLHLKSSSTNARYYCYRFTPDELVRLNKDHLQKIKSELAPH